MPDTIVRPHPWTVETVQDLLIDFVAELLGETAEDLRRTLNARGPMMPIDSLDLFDVLKEFRQRTGLRVDPRKLRRDTMGSIRKFADAVVENNRG